MDKTCTICKEKKKLEDFNKNKTKKDGYNNICRSCSQIRSRLYYEENGEKHRKCVGVIRKKNQSEIKSLRIEIKKKGCFACPERESCAIDFHHLDRNKKAFNIGENHSNNFYRTTFLNEVEKCILLCANCHRKYHHGILTLPDNISPINVDEFRK